MIFWLEKCTKFIKSFVKIIRINNDYLFNEIVTVIIKIKIFIVVLILGKKRKQSLIVKKCFCR